MRGPRATSGRARLVGATVAVFLLYFGVHLWMEFQSSRLLGGDGYYHVKVAYLYRTGECAITGGDFPWTRFSSYHRLRHDWALGYHLALIPFTFLDLETGARVSTAFFAGMLFATMYLVLRLHRVPWPWLFTVIGVLASSTMLWRYHYARPTPFLLTFLLLLAHFLARKRPLATGVVIVLGLLVYNIPHSMIAAVVLALAIHTVLDRRFPGRLAAGAGLAVVLGIGLHPGFWHWEGSFFGPDHATFRLWEQVQGSMQISLEKSRVTIGDETVRMNLGTEFQPMNTRAMKEDFSLPLGLVVGALVLAGIRGRRLSAEALVYLSLAAAYFTLFLDHMRFYEYWVPLAIVAAGLLLGPVLVELPVLGGAPEAIEERARGPATRTTRVLVGIALLGLGVQVVLLAVSPDRVRELAFWTPNLVAAASLVAVSLSIRLPEGVRLARGVPPRDLVIGVLVAAPVLATVASLAARNAREARALLEDERYRSADRFGPAMDWLETNSESGALVFHTSWDNFGPMFFHNHANHYLVGFDPYFLYQLDPERYLLWKRICDDQLNGPETVEGIRSFGASFVLTLNDPRFVGMRDKLIRVKGCRVAYFDEYVTILEMT